MAVGTESQDFQALRTGSSVDQDQVWSNVTLATIFPLSAESMISNTHRKHLSGGQSSDDLQCFVYGPCAEFLIRRQSPLNAVVYAMVFMMGFFQAVSSVLSRLRWSRSSSTDAT